MATVSFRVWGCAHGGFPALAQRLGAGVQEGDWGERSVILSHGLTLHRIAQCYQLPSIVCCMKTWSLFVLFLWEGVKKAADLGSAPLTGLGGAKVLQIYQGQVHVSTPQRSRAGGNMVTN